MFGGEGDFWGRCAGGIAGGQGVLLLTVVCTKKTIRERYREDGLTSLTVAPHLLFINLAKQQDV